MSHFKILPNGRTVDHNCQKCGLWKLCKSPRMEGEGTNHPVYAVVGEAPGGTEDDLDLPFQGDAGIVLRETIERVGIKISECRFTNAVRCRPPDNKLSSFPHAIDYCRPNILRELHVLKPKVVILLGNSAIQSVLRKKGILKLHGQVFEDRGIKFVCAFHPAYLLRQDTPGTREKFKQAFKVAKSLVDGESKKHREKKREHIVIADRHMAKEFTSELLSRKGKGQAVITDMEGSTLSPFTRMRKSRIGCVGFALDENTSVIYPGTARIGWEHKLRHFSHRESMEHVKEIYENSELVGHFEKYGYVQMIACEGIWGGGRNHETGFYADTGYMSYTLKETKGGHELKDWSYALGMGNYELPFEQWKRDNKPFNDKKDREHFKNFLYAPANLLYPYNGDDNIACFRLYIKLRKKLKEKGLWDMPLRFPLMWHFWTASMMELEGLNLDLERNAELAELFEKRIAKLDEKLNSYPEVKALREAKRVALMSKLLKKVSEYKKQLPDVKKKVLELYANQIAKLEREGKDILNISAAEVKRKLVYDVLQYPITVVTGKTKEPSTEKRVLEELYEKKKTTLLKKIIERSTLESSKSKYIDPIPEWAGIDGRTHTQYKPHGQKTGRVSSENPNHENLPKRYDLALLLRSQFVSRGGDYLLLELDEKHMELRLIADRAKDKALIKEFRARKDPHKMGAAAAFEIPEEQVTKEQRFDAKSAVSFGLIYGRTAYALAQSFGWKESKADEFVERYFGKYYGVRRYLNKERELLLKKAVAVSHFNRHRRVPDVFSDNEGQRDAAVREGINAPIQGDGSDVVWIAGHRMMKWLFKHKMKSRVVIIIHDAIVVDMHKDEAKRIIAKLSWFMRDKDFIEKMTGWRCLVPFDVDGSVGMNLGKMPELVPGKHSYELRIPKAA
jgi:uracil-DNA glycosylase family 4